IPTPTRRSSDLAEKPAEQARRMREAIPADKHGWWWGTGRRKSAVARVRMRPAESGKGDFRIQITRKKFKTIDEYFCELRDRADCTAPMRITDTEGKFDVVVRCIGGRSEEHTSELQSRENLVCRLLL